MCHLMLCLISRETRDYQKNFAEQKMHPTGFTEILLMTACMSFELYILQSTFISVLLINVPNYFWNSGHGASPVQQMRVLTQQNHRNEDNFFCHWPNTAAQLRPSACVPLLCMSLNLTPQAVGATGVFWIEEYQDQNCAWGKYPEWFGGCGRVLPERDKKLAWWDSGWKGEDGMLLKGLYKRNPEYAGNKPVWEQEGISTEKCNWHSLQVGRITPGFGNSHIVRSIFHKFRELNLTLVLLWWNLNSSPPETNHLGDGINTLIKL